MKTMCVNPIIAAAIEKRRNAFVVRNLEQAKTLVERVFADIASAGWDLDVYAPRPHYDMSGEQYKKAKNKRNFAATLTQAQEGSRRSIGKKLIKRDEDRISRFLENIKILASSSFDAYVAKLSRKIGECVAANVDDAELWHGSVLTITRADGSIEKWKTKTIINISCLGTRFNQWPTRKIRSK